MQTEAHSTISLFGLEFDLTIAIVVLALCFPHFGSKFFLKLENAFGRLARKRVLSVWVCGITACALRLAMLPFLPIPQPWIQDDFSYLLAADTFAHGRLTNPTHPMWMHFESFHIDFHPTYMSMYFPAQGMVMAAGKLLAGHPWWGIWVSCGLMCAAICWMLQGWLPPGWALLGGMLAVIRLGLFSYWMNTYTGGAVAAIGGALVVGAIPRICRSFRARDFFWTALGLVLLANTRPYEGILVSVPALLVIAWSFWKKPHPDGWVLVRRMAPAAVLLATAIAWMGYYNYRVFGNALTPPYKINREIYASAPHFVWQSARPEPVYRHRAMRNFYSGWELRTFREETGSLSGFADATWSKLLEAGYFFFNLALLPPLFMLPWALRDRRFRPLTLIGTVVLFGLLIETWFIPHYLAPATAVLYAVLLQSMRHLRVWRPAGLFLVRATPVLCVVLAIFRLYAQPMNIQVASAPYETAAWYGGTSVGLERARVLAKLESLPGPQLAIVRYAPNHLYPEWVYNAADIDKSKVVWARAMGPVSDSELLNYYKERKAWLIEPDCHPPRISLFAAANRDVETHPSHCDAGASGGK